MKTSHEPIGRADLQVSFLDQIIRQPPNPPGLPGGSRAWNGFPAAYGMDPRVANDPLYRDRMKPALQSLPTLSIVCRNEDLFGSRNGLYLHAEARGEMWERPCSAELILPDGSNGFRVDCGLRMQGNSTRLAMKTPKHAFRLTFKEKFGPTKLNDPIFPDSPVTKFDTFVLRAAQFIDYLVLNYYVGNRDWGDSKNWYAIRRRAPAGPFQFLVWDAEQVLLDARDDLLSSPYLPPFRLAEELAANSEFKLAFADRVQKHFFNGGALTPAAAGEPSITRPTDSIRVCPPPAPFRRTRKPIRARCPSRVPRR